MNKKDRAVSTCCDALAKVNMVREEGETRFMFCTKCLQPCDTKAAEGFGQNKSTLTATRKPSGERALFIRLWAKCGGKSEVSGEALVPPEHPLFHFQGCHLLPKGAYQDERLLEENVVMTTAEEHTDEWPFVKELTDEELRQEGQAKWIPVVARFRKLRLKSNLKMRAALSGKL